MKYVLHISELAMLKMQILIAVTQEVRNPDIKCFSQRLYRIHVWFSFAIFVISDCHWRYSNQWCKLFFLSFASSADNTSGFYWTLHYLHDLLILYSENKQIIGTGYNPIQIWRCAWREICIGESELKWKKMNMKTGLFLQKCVSSSETGFHIWWDSAD